VPDIDDLSTLTGLDEVHIIERRIADTLRACVASREALGASRMAGWWAPTTSSRWPRASG
jgi:hypothetical protein